MAKLSPALAKSSQPADAFAKSSEREDFRHFRRNRRETLATLATLAGGDEWKDGIAALIGTACPHFHTLPIWDTICWRVHRFAVEWADDGLRYGWTLLDMFGCNPDPAARRVDRNGVAMTLARMLSPLTVAAVDADGWHLADQRGSLMRYPRMERQGQVLIWDAYSARAGP